MQVIPAINGKTFDEVKRQFAFFKNLLPEHKGFIHLDVTDGEYSSYSLWNNPEDLTELPTTNYRLPIFEVHLMVQNPENVIDRWLLPCVGRVVFHPEASQDLGEVIQKCREKNIEVAISLAPHVVVDQIAELVSLVDMVQVLTVVPGAPGQSFGEDSLQKVHALRNQFPDVIIEVDGGITPETAKAAKEAGANIVISASYIMGSEDPGKAYQELVAI